MNIRVTLLSALWVFVAIAQAHAAESTFRDCPECPEMVPLPGGTFLMGTPASELEREDDEGPQRTVNVEPFSLGRYEVTRGQFADFVRDTSYVAGSVCYVLTRDGKFAETRGKNWRNPGFKQTDAHPVVCVNWDDATAYANWLSRKTGKTYRLPSEAEWEYAARALTVTARPWGEDPHIACTYANVADRVTLRRFPRWTVHQCSDGYINTAPVGRFSSNSFQVHDALGNVWEWTMDCANESYAAAPSDGSAWLEGDCAQRILRGGSWYSHPSDVRVGYRDRDSFKMRASNTGFRVARTAATARLSGAR